MSGIGRLAEVLDRFGLRRPLAALATLAYPGQKFEVDRHGRWLNVQDKATIVSTTINTKNVRDLFPSVLRDWCRDYQPRAGDIVLDIGSGVGEEILVFSDMVADQGRVVAVEAHPSTFGCLQETIRLSDLKNVSPLGVAVAEQDGEIVISTTDNHLANSVVNAGRGQKVEAVTIDSICARHGIDRIDFLRMNIEGAERLAVSGMRGIATKVRHACISCHDFVADATGDDTMRTKELVRSTLVDLGFEVWERDDWARDAVWQRDYLYAKRPS